MADFLHGAYGSINAAGSRAAATSSAFVYVGTAPVHTVAGGASNVNVPILVNNFAEARKYFGYSSDWASYTLCEAIYDHLVWKGVGPLILINVLDPATHRSSQKATASKTPANGKLTIADAESVILDTVVIKAGDVAKVLGTDYTIAYDYTTKTITATELTAGALGSAALTVEYYTATPSTVTNENIIGTSDGLGLNTGLWAIKNVYQLTNQIPAFLAAPGWSSIKAVHDAMGVVSKKINGHWDAFMFTDLPLLNGSTPLTLDTVATYKAANGYDKENEKVFFPMVAGTDGQNHHLSVIAAANFQELMLDADGIPYRSASNTAANIIQNLYFGANDTGRIYDDEIINEKLNKKGITSAVYVGGRWVIWGAQSAAYDFSTLDSAESYVNRFETNIMMLYYVSNDFQARRVFDVDQPMTINDLNAIVAEEQSRLDALLNVGALTYGECHLNAEGMSMSDVVNGDFSFTFNVTATPLAKSLTAMVNWTDEGFVTFFNGFNAE